MHVTAEAPGCHHVCTQFIQMLRRAWKRQHVYGAVVDALLSWSSLETLVAHFPCVLCSHLERFSVTLLKQREAFCLHWLLIFSSACVVAGVSGRC